MIRRRQVLSQARQIAEEVLFPAAMDVDAADRVPAGALRCAGQRPGCTGWPGRPPAGGLDADLATFCTVIEIMASGCLATTFVWLQHHSAVRALAAIGQLGAARAVAGSRSARGEQRAGIALGGARPGPPLLRARPFPAATSLTAPRRGSPAGTSSTSCTRWPGMTAGKLVAALLPAVGPGSPARRTASTWWRSTPAARSSCAFTAHFVPSELVSGDACRTRSGSPGTRPGCGQRLAGARASPRRCCAAHAARLRSLRPATGASRAELAAVRAAL